jgi:hypothetical protein
MLLCSNELFVVLAGIRSLSLNVRYRGNPDKHMLVLSITGFDPTSDTASHPTNATPLARLPECYSLTRYDACLIAGTMR